MHKVTQSQNLYTHPAGIQLRGRHPGFSIQRKNPKKPAVRQRDEPVQEGNVEMLHMWVPEGRTVPGEAEAALREQEQFLWAKGGQLQGEGSAQALAEHCRSDTAAGIF